jgi:multidrug efflux pump subunit AcrA (membrane-fusion protein)
MAVGVLVLAGCYGERAAEAPRVEPPIVRGVRVEALGAVRLPATVEAVGTVRSRTQTLVASKVMGYVREVRVREGDRVEAGQLLVAVEELEFATRVDRAAAGLREASASRDEAKQMLEEAEAGLVSAKAEHAYAEVTAMRYRKLLTEELISVQDFDSVEAKRKSAAAVVEQARARILSLRAREAQAHQRIEQATAELRVAEITLGDARIMAPMAGIVVEKRVEPGSLAVPGQPLLTLEDPRHYRLEALVGESAMARVSVGQTVPVVLDSLPRSVEGRVVEVIPAADPASRSVAVRLDLPPDLPIRSGVFGRARFPGGERTVLLVPVSALVERGQLEGVYVVDALGRAALRVVTVGQRDGDRVEVLSGLDPGERVVVDGVVRVRDGSQVDSGG